jgi:ectoine hydroxylase-related dioxygenase (phytanoyl-CoA dioxygenase family)
MPTGRTASSSCADGSTPARSAPPFRSAIASGPASPSIARTRAFTGADVGGGEVADRIDPILDISPFFADLSRDARLAGPAGQLLDGTAVPFRSKIITKRPETLGYSLHQDYPYWAHLGLPPDAFVNALVAFDRFDASSGSPEIFPGLHHGRIPAPPENAYDADETLVDGCPSVILDLAPGDFAFFHGLAPHRSGPNRAAHPRRGLFLTYVPSRYTELEARYVIERVDLRP